MSIYKKMFEIFEILSIDPNLDFLENGVTKIQNSDVKLLMQLSKKKLTLPVKNFEGHAWKFRSPLKDEFVGLNKFAILVSELSKYKSIIRLNHVGFCYKVKSQSDEKERLISRVKESELQLYEENSNDAGLWLFAGDTKVWSDPLIEFLPVEETSDKYTDYWLPHIQIDIDTTLTSKEIKEKVNEVFGEYPSIFPITIIDEIIYAMRLRLGIKDGINIDLDIATNSRNVKLHREKLLTQLG